MPKPNALQEVLHEKYKSKNVKVMFGIWLDASCLPAGVTIEFGAVLQAVGYLDNDPSVLIWHIVSRKLPPPGLSWAEPPTLRSLITIQPCVIFGSIPRGSFNAVMDLPIFCSPVYPNMGLVEVAADVVTTPVPVPKPKLTPRPVPTCPKCGSTDFYLGFSSMKCGTPGCDPRLKKTEVQPPEKRSGMAWVCGCGHTLTRDGNSLRIMRELHAQHCNINTSSIKKVDP